MKSVTKLKADVGVDVANRSHMPISSRWPRPIILCIEDEDTQLWLRKAVLEESGYQVLTASGASEALRIVRENPISLVVSDHMLGRTTGAELAKNIRAIRPDLPIMLYSGNLPEHLGDVSCFVSKGESVTTVLSMIADLIRRYSR